MHQASKYYPLQAYNMIVRAYKAFCLRSYINNNIQQRKHNKADKVIRKSIYTINKNLDKSIIRSLSMADKAIEEAELYDSEFDDEENESKDDDELLELMT